MCVVTHADHCHIRFRGRRGGTRGHSVWYQMPAALGVMMNLLPPEKYRVHLHTAWQDEHAPEVTGLEAKAKLALH